MLVDKTFTHYVLKSSGLTERYVAVGTFKGNLQPAGAETTALIGGVFGKSFKLFTTYSGLNLYDAVASSGTTTTSGMFYKINGVEPYNYGPLKHFEVMVNLPEV